MKANITFKNAAITLANVEVSHIGKYCISFELNEDMMNATMYQLLMKAEATISEGAFSNKIFVAASPKVLYVDFV